MKISKNCSNFEEQSDWSYGKIFYPFILLKVYMKKLGLSFLFIAVSFTILGQWKLSNLPRFRSVNDLVFAGNRLIAVGGHETNDAITGIYISQDSGRTWNIVMDSPNSPWLRALSFPSSSIGFAAGDNGLVMKTSTGGDTWTMLSLPQDIALRNFHSVFFTSEDTGFIAGGQYGADTLHTFAVTFDGGNNWNVRTNEKGQIYKTCWFFNSKEGLIAGEKGILLLTFDGGLSWESPSVPSSVQGRDWNALYFKDRLTGFAAGGHPSNEAIQTIIRTTDGGHTWEVVHDSLAPILNDICLASTTDGYAVGNLGTFLKTTDGGLTWVPLGLPSSLNDERNLQATGFLNRLAGVAAGSDGKVLIYADSSLHIPVIGSLKAQLISPGKIKLKAQVNPNGLPTHVYFGYGKDTPDENIHSSVPEMLSGVDWQNVSVTLTGLDPNAFYVFRVQAENKDGTSTSQTLSFFAGTDIPNWSFELWDTLVSETPEQWMTVGSVEKVEGENGTTAAKLQAKDNEPGVVLIGNLNNGNFEGGVPFAGQPDTIGIKVKYEIAYGDSAFVLLLLKKEGTPVAQGIFKIGGSSGGQFVTRKFRIPYQILEESDSIIVGIASTDVFAGKIDPSSVILIDDIFFMHTTATLFNSDFEQWKQVIRYIPKGWYPGEDNKILQSESPIHISENAFDGSYALDFRNLPHEGYNQIFLSTSPFKSVRPSFPVSGRHNALYGYIGFEPNGNDTLFVSISMFLNGTTVGEGFYSLTEPIEPYQQLEIPIWYVTQDVIPDSSFIGFSFNSKPSVNTRVFVDALSFDTPALKINNNKARGKNVIYPNPFRDIIHIDWPESEGKTMVIELYEITGRKLFSERTISHGRNTVRVTGSSLSRGMYLLRVWTPEDGSGFTQEIVHNQ